jgi:hypothetical protein
MGKIELDSKKFYFGKYKGLTVGQVFIKDPGYIVWVYENLDADKRPTITHEMYMDAMEAVEEVEDNFNRHVGREARSLNPMHISSYFDEYE